MTMLLDGRLRDLATQTHLLETKVSSLGWMAGAGAQTLSVWSGLNSKHVTSQAPFRPAKAVEA